MKTFNLKSFFNRLFYAAFGIIFLFGAGSVCFAQYDTLPLYRRLVVEQKNPNDLFSPLLEDRHYYTTDKNKASQKNLKDEGIEGYLLPLNIHSKENAPLFHLVRSKDGKHFYTNSGNEANEVSNYAGYEQRETLGYLWVKQIAETVPLYRLYRAGKRDDHFYTTKEADKNRAISKYGYKLEGIVGYVYAKPTKVGANGYPNAGFPSAPKNMLYAQKNRKNFEFVAGQMLGANALTDKQIADWVEMMIGAPYSFALADDTATTSQINQFFRKLLASPEGGGWRQMLVGNGIRAVYNKPSSPTDLATYEPQIKNGKVFFSDVRSNETAKLVADSRLHPFTIRGAYNFAFGRYPDADELQNWVNRKRGYAETIELMRQYLYSSAGSKDLVEMLTLALTTSNGKPPSPDAVKNAVQQYAYDRKIYSEIKK